MIGRDGIPCYWCHFRKGRAEFLNPAVRVEWAIGSQRMSSLVFFLETFKDSMQCHEFEVILMLNLWYT